MDMINFNKEILLQFFEMNSLYSILLIALPVVIPFCKPCERSYDVYKMIKLSYLNLILIHGSLKNALLAKFSKKEKLGNIGILATHFAEVKDIPKNLVHKDYIYLLANKDDDYETRRPLDDKECLEKIVDDIIYKHYDHLNNKLMQKGWMNDSLFNIEYDGKMRPMCDVMKDIYNVDTLWKAIESVKDSIGNDGAIKFIGNKIGICGFSMEGSGQNKKLLLHVYETDHFTFKVFKYIFKDIRYNKVFRTLISHVNQAKGWEKKSMLVEAMAFLFSSMGVDILIGGRDISGRRRLLVAARNGEVESDHVSTLHIPVNESFSNTDVDGDVYSVTTCVVRGIKEELGIPKEMIDIQNISFHDFAIVADEGEIGFGCYVDLSERLPLEQCRMYPGQDKFLELNNIFILPYPKFKKKPEDYEDIFYSMTGDDRFCMKWQSFATLIYQRAILRNKKTGLIASTFFEMILLVGILLLLAWGLGRDCREDIYPEIVSGMIAIVTHLIVNKYRFFIKKKGLFKPFIPQWNGDCKVLQSSVDFIDDEMDKMLKDSRRFGLLMPNSFIKVCELSDLSLLMPPFCSVRRKSHDFSEYPISFYYMNLGHNIGNNSLKLIQIYFSSDNDGEVALCMNIEKKNGVVKGMRFTDEYNGKITLKFDKSFSSDEIRTYSKYYNLDETVLPKVKYATFDDVIMDNYEFYDLFQFNNTYYWSIYVRNHSLPVGEICNIGPRTKPKDIYEKYIQKSFTSNIKEVESNCIEENFWVIFKGKKPDVERFVCEFTSRADNRNRMSELDLYTMQLFLIRKGIVFAKIQEGYFKRSN